MERSFEDVVSSAMDDLYAGALYLCAGDEREAEELLVDTLMGSAPAYTRERPLQPGEWLDGRLVRSYLSRSEPRWAAAGASTPARMVAKPAAAWSREDVFRVMNRLSPPVRSTMWLVVIRRRSYRSVAEILGTDRSGVAAWVREGHQRMARMAGTGPPPGTAGRANQP